ncbi:MAG: hypothetical protein BJ554DRAFT_5998, partial [Olpidium bornovanus]
TTVLLYHCHAATYNNVSAGGGHHDEARANERAASQVRPPSQPFGITPRTSSTEAEPFRRRAPLLQSLRIVAQGLVQLDNGQRTTGDLSLSSMPSRRTARSSNARKTPSDRPKAPPVVLFFLVHLHRPPSAQSPLPRETIHATLAGRPVPKRRSGANAEDQVGGHDAKREHPTPRARQRGLRRCARPPAPCPPLGRALLLASVRRLSSPPASPPPPSPPHAHAHNSLSLPLSLSELGEKEKKKNKKRKNHSTFTTLYPHPASRVAPTPRRLTMAADAAATNADAPAAANKFVAAFTDPERAALKQLRDRLPLLTARLPPAEGEDQKNACGADAPAPPPPTPPPPQLWGVPLAADSTDPRLDVILIKFLRARSLHVDATAAMLAASLAWREKFCVDAILDERFPEDVFRNVGYLHKTDRDGRPVCFNAYGNLAPEVFADVDRFVRWRVQFMEKGIRQGVDFVNADSMVQVLHPTESAFGFVSSVAPSNFISSSSIATLALAFFPPFWIKMMARSLPRFFLIDRDI